MADDWTTNKLKQWGLGCLVEVFRDNAIDKEAFEELRTSPDVLNEVVPKAGIRMKFTKHFRAEFPHQPTQSIPLVLSSHDSSSLSSVVCMEEDSFTELSSTAGSSRFSDTFLESQSQSPSSLDYTYDCDMGQPITVTLKTQEKPDDLFDPKIGEEPELFPSSQSSRASTPIPSTQPVHMSPQTSPFSPTSSVDCDPEFPPPLKRQKKPVFFDVLHILNKTSAGRACVESGQKKHLFTDSETNTVNEILVQQLVEEYGESPSSFVKEALAQAVISAFPFLKDPLGATGYEKWWYQGRSQHPGGGRIEARLKYVRNALKNKKKQRDVMKTVKKTSKSQSQSKVTSDTISPETQQKIAWLKHNLEPTELVSTYMRETFQARQHFMGKSTLSEILQEYPRILNIGMIEQDFQLLYPDKATNFISTWPELSGFFLRYLQTKEPNWGTDWLDIHDTADIPDVEKENVALQLLPLLMKGRAKGGRGRCGYTSSLESFVDLKSESCNMDAYLKEINPVEKPQPFVLILGSRMAPSQAFVVIERTALPTPTLLKAVDMCLKAHYVLGLEFQCQCQGAWQFVEVIGFKMQPKKDLYTSVTEFNAFYNFMKQYNKT